MMFTNKVYDVLKWIAMLLLPALGTLYFALAQVWGFPYGEQVVATIVAIDTFLGAILELSNTQYRKYLMMDPTKYSKDDILRSRMSGKSD